MLASLYNTSHLLEAGLDEAGRGCLAGEVFAAAVIFPPDYENDELNDSKQLTDRRRRKLRPIIERDALAWAVASVSPEEIDRINILNASILAMHRALDALSVRPQFLIVDGNRFKPYQNLPHQTIVKGDGKFLSIAAASILAKTYRDDRCTNSTNSILSTTGFTTPAIPRFGTAKAFSPMDSLLTTASPSADSASRLFLSLKKKNHVSLPFSWLFCTKFVILRTILKV